jgi:uncharacterized protein (TIGR03000 family)
MSRLYSRTVLALSFCALVATPAPAGWPLGSAIYAERWPIPPSHLGFDLHNPTPGYYGGAYYRQYYSFGTGYGIGSYPGFIPRDPLVAREQWEKSWPPPAIITVPRLPSPAHDLAPVVRLTVRVPETAEVWIEGMKSKQSGPLRTFVSPPLKVGDRYAFAIRAAWTENGQPRNETREVIAGPGERVDVAFPAEPEPEKLPAPRQLPAELLK